MPDDPRSAYEIASLRAIERDEARRAEEHERLLGSLAAFMKAAWRWLEPGKPLIWGWHIDCILEHLEAVDRHEIGLLLLNVPPRHIKSTLTSVIFPAWIWTKRPWLRLLTGSYAMPLSIRDATRSRRLITSPWYGREFPNVQLQPDQKAKQRYDLVGGGARYCFSTDGTVTGEGADVLIWDDPHKAADMRSPAKLETAIEFWSETLPTRMDDPEKGTKIVIMQRLGERDLSGHMLREALEHKDSNLVHVSLPVHFDPRRACKTRWFRDPRKEPGELLWPERMNKRAIRTITREMSAPAIAAQLEQAPATRSGSIFPRSRWRVWTGWQAPVCQLIVVSVDAALKAKEENDPWACTVWGAFLNHEDAPEEVAKAGAEGRELWNVVLLDAWEEWLSYPLAKAKVLQSIENWTIEGEVPDAVVIEDKVAGSTLIGELDAAGIPNIVPWPPKGAYRSGMPDKVERAQLVSDIHYHRRAWLLGRKLSDKTRSGVVVQPFADKVAANMAAFPAGDHDDLTDTATQAWAYIRSQQYVDLDTDLDTALNDMQSPPEVEDRRRESAYG